MHACSAFIKYALLKYKHKNVITNYSGGSFIASMSYVAKKYENISTHYAEIFKGCQNANF